MDIHESPDTRMQSLRNGIEDEWRAEILEREEMPRPDPALFLSGDDLMSDHPGWGTGLPQGKEVGEIKKHLAALQEQGVIRSREEAIQSVRGKIVLHHLLDHPVSYLETLRERGLLAHILPEVAILVGLEQSNVYHTEDAYSHTLSVMRALPEGSSRELTLAAVFHDVGKADTRTFDQETGLHHFYGHETRGAELFQEAFERLNWQEEDFAVEKVLWLIRNHLKTKIIDWREIEDPGKTVRRLFFAKKGEPPIPPDYRNDLLALSLADALGAEAEDGLTRKTIMERESRLLNLVKEVEEDLKRKEEEGVLNAKISQIWNGHQVIHHFRVEGQKIGRLLKIGQQYVRERLARGEEPVTEAEIVDHIKGEEGES